MNDKLLIKVVVVLLICCLIGISGYGAYCMITGKENIKEIDVEVDEDYEDYDDYDDYDDYVDEDDYDDDKKFEDDSDFSDDDLDIDSLITLFPGAFYAFDSGVEGYVKGKIKNVNNISDKDLIKLVIYDDNRKTESVTIPASFGGRTFGPEEKKTGDLIETRIFTHEEIKKKISEIFGKERANKLVFPEFISYGNLSTKFTNIYYSIDDKYYEGYAAVGNQVNFSKEYVSYSFFSETDESIEGTLIITYLVQKNYVNEVVDEYYVSETYKRDKYGNFTWISIERE